MLRRLKGLSPRQKCLKDEEYLYLGAKGHRGLLKKRDTNQYLYCKAVGTKPKPELYLSKKKCPGQDQNIILVF